VRALTGRRRRARAAIRRAARRGRRALLHPLLEFVLPTDCFACGAPVDADQRMGACSRCWAGLRPLPRPACPGCGMPAPAATDLLGPARGFCVGCQSERRALDGVRAAVAYDDLARAFILRAKLGGRPELLRAIADLTAADLRASGLLDRRAVLVPVPSHPWADLRRGFSPAVEIARRLGEVLGLEVRRRLVARRWLPLGPLKRLGRGRRRLTAREGFRVRRGAAPPPRVLLADDVMTTGATLESCARALKAAGAAEVRAVVWARALIGP